MSMASSRRRRRAQIGKDAPFYEQQRVKEDVQVGDGARSDLFLLQRLRFNLRSLL